MAERIVHRLPPGEYTRVELVHDSLAGNDPRRSLCYLLVNKGLRNGGVVLARLTRKDLADLAAALDNEWLGP